MLAPAGTGKTEVLSMHILNALKKGAAPQEILCLTFTNRAASFMKKRLDPLLENRRGKIVISTFHGKD